jgi:hypothetical protein
MPPDIRGKSGEIAEKGGQISGLFGHRPAAGNGPNQGNRQAIKD